MNEILRIMVRLKETHGSDGERQAAHISLHLRERQKFLASKEKFFRMVWTRKK